MAGADKTTHQDGSDRADPKTANTGEEPLDQAEMGDADSGGVAGQGGMRGQTETSDPGKFKPS